MSEVNIEICPLCEDEIQYKESLGWPRRKKQVHGFCAEVGFSKGGWGSRENFFAPLSAELCPACWEELAVLAMKMADKIKALRGSRAVKVTVSRVAVQGTEGKG